MVRFDAIEVGEQYNRPKLAELWGYASFNAISRGVFSPKGQNILVFFVTKEKQEALTQYEDHIDADILFWEGEKGHGNDHRIVAGRDEIHVFYRTRHHSPFTYQGRAVLRSHYLLTNRPSRFTFQLIDRKIDIADMVQDIQADYNIPVTEREAIITSRVGQGLFRRESIKLWKTCSVTGFTKESILIASHIKPWKLSDNRDRINPHNSLLLVPTLDKLFDTGHISFEPSGKIRLSDNINQPDWDRIGVHAGMKLKEVPKETRAFLEYHGEYVFGLG